MKFCMMVTLARAVNTRNLGAECKDCVEQAQQLKYLDTNKRLTPKGVVFLNEALEAISKVWPAEEAEDISWILQKGAR